MVLGGADPNLLRLTTLDNTVRREKEGERQGEENTLNKD